MKGNETREESEGEGKICDMCFPFSSCGGSFKSYMKKLLSLIYIILTCYPVKNATKSY